MKIEVKVKEDANGNLVLEDGTVIPEYKRTKSEIYSRCCGYLRPVEAWNVGKQVEFHDRKLYDVGLHGPKKEQEAQDNPTRTCCESDGCGCTQGPPI